MHSALCRAVLFTGFSGFAYSFCYSQSTCCFFSFPSFGRAVENGKQINAFLSLTSLREPENADYKRADYDLKYRLF